MRARWPLAGVEQAVVLGVERLAVGGGLRHTDVGRGIPLDRQARAVERAVGDGVEQRQSSNCPFSEPRSGLSTIDPEVAFTLTRAAEIFTFVVCPRTTSSGVLGSARTG